jgi:hypothetical protein
MMNSKLKLFIKLYQISPYLENWLSNKSVSRKNPVPNGVSKTRLIFRQPLDRPDITKTAAAACPW